MLVNPAHSQSSLQVFYDERIPYAIAEDTGEVRGLTATPVAEAFQKAGIEFEWKKMPFKRQLATIKSNKKQVCGIGWFKKPEREEFARYSKTIYQDKPTTILSRKHSDLDQYKSVDQLIKSDSVKLLVKDGFSYGKFLDDLILQEQPTKIVVVGSSNLEMLKMIISGRADYLFVSEEEAEEIIKSAGFPSDQFTLHQFPDIPPGNNRFLACSKKVSPSSMDQFNQALSTLK